LLRRPFLVGVAHGLAGSGALTALALAAMPSVSSALIYLALFAVGSVAAMALATGLMGWPLERASRSPRWQAAVSSLAGILSLATGLLWGWKSLFG
jgi:cytochrome c biogenesis protein CcdA